MGVVLESKIGSLFFAVRETPKTADIRRLPAREGMKGMGGGEARGKAPGQVSLIPVLVN